MALERLAWGNPMQPPDSAVAAWGARAIYHPFNPEFMIDILPDRQDWQGPEEDCKALSTWLKEGLKKLKSLLVDKCVGSNDETIVGYMHGGFGIQATPNRSYGYLYIVAWKAPARE